LIFNFYLRREKPKDVEWNELNEKKINFLLNFIQCKLSLKEYYSVIEHAGTILEFQPNNLKALFRRAKAHKAVFNINEAKEDFNKLISLDDTLKQTCLNELNEFEKEIKIKNENDKQLFKGKLFS
jgi:AH receptor-interacting protein